MRSWTFTRPDVFLLVAGIGLVPKVTDCNDEPIKLVYYHVFNLVWKIIALWNRFPGHYSK